MTQEDKQLLLKDLCARLPYGVKIKVRSNDTRTVRAVDVVEGIVHFVEPDSISPYGVHIEHPTTFHQVVKPYLRPMSSMTDEEEARYNLTQGMGHWTADDGKLSDYADAIDWLNEHHFDVRNLIGRGLAIDCTNLNIY